MKYMLLTRYTAEEFDGLTMSEEEMATMVKFMDDLNEELKASGELVDAQGLGLPKDARTVRYVDDAPVVTDGPFGEAKEVLAGYWVLACTAERAEEVAARVVAFSKEPIEIRQVLDEPPV